METLENKTQFRVGTKVYRGNDEYEIIELQVLSNEIVIATLKADCDGLIYYRSVVIANTGKADICVSIMDNAYSIGPKAYYADRDMAAHVYRMDVEKDMYMHIGQHIRETISLIKTIQTL